MAEKPDIRRDIDDIQIAEIDKTQVGTIDPGLKDAGYSDGSTPTAKEHTALFEGYYNQLRHILGQVPRVFPTLGEALDLVDGTDPGVPIVQGDRFVVDGLFGGGAALFKLGDLGFFNAAGNPILDLACDGQLVFLAVGATVQANNNLGSAHAGWSVTPNSPNAIIVLEADNLFVYAAATVTNDVFLLNKATGATVATILTPAATVVDLAANGVHLVIADGQVARVYDTLGAAPNLVGTTVAHGAPLFGLAVDHDQGYLCGSNVGGINVRAFPLAAPGAFTWSVMLPGVTTAHQIEADGAFVYVTSTTSTGLGGASVWCLRRRDGVIIWHSVLDTALAANECIVDHRHLWVTELTGDVTYALDKSSGAEVFRKINTIVACSDGHQAFTFVPGAGGLVNGLRSGEFRTFVVVPDDAADRKPFPRISVPIAEPPLGDTGNGLIEDIAEATGTITDPGVSDVLATGMTLTPPAGTYQVWFSGTVDHSMTDESIFPSIYAGGVQAAASERPWRRGAGQGDVQSSFACMARVTVNGAQAIEGRWRTPVVIASMYQRTLMIRSV